MRCATGTKSGPPCVVTRATKSVIDVLVGPSFHDGSPSACACAGMERSGPIRAGSTASVESRTRRLRVLKEDGIGFIVVPPCDWLE